MYYLDTCASLTNNLWSNSTVLQRIWIAWTILTLFVLFPPYIFEKWLLNTKILKFNEEEVRGWRYSWNSFHRAMNMYYWLSITVALEQIVLNMCNIQAIPLTSRVALRTAYHSTTVAFIQATTFFYNAVGYCFRLFSQIKTVPVNYLYMGIISFSYLAKLVTNDAKFREQAARAPPDWLFAPETYGNQLNKNGITTYNDDDINKKILSERIKTQN